MLNVEFGKSLIIIGAVIVLAGVAVLTFNKIPFLGRLPGDINIQKENFTFTFPVVTCLLLSVIASLLFWVFSRK